MKAALTSRLIPSRLRTPAAALGLGLLALVALPLSWPTQAADGADKKVPAKRAMAITVAQPKIQSWEVGITASGGIHPWQEAVVASELGGLAIRELQADIGSHVKRGQVLARLDQETVRAALISQQANVTRARTALAEARTQAERAEKLKDSGALSEQQIQQLQFAHESARAALAAAEALLHADEVRLQQTLIRAADDGVISARTATLGAVVQPGAELFRLVRKGRIEWRAELTAEQLGRLKPGLKASVRLSDGTQAEGKVRLLSPTLDPASRKALAYVDLAAGSNARAGMFGQGEILLGVQAALTVPNSAILLRDGNSYVFEIVAGNLAELRKVETGRHQGNAVEIRSGLTKEARIVTRGAAFLNPGDPVQIVADLGDQGSKKDDSAKK